MREDNSPYPRERATTQKATILVVDDDPLMRTVTKELLALLDYEVHVAASGEDALSLLAEASFDLLILDMIMPPGIDGAETYRQVKMIRPSQRAIVLSGYAESDRVRAALTLGVGAFLRKPITLAQLGKAVQAELERTI
jgi:CheY-like chemotaxis protein